ncbi:MAG: phage tail protein, partial [Mycobacterium leprae]
ANSVAELAGTEWRLEPLPYRRSGVTDLAWHQPYPHNEEGGAWELLLQQAIGRYLQLRLTLTAAGRATPRIRAMRVWYPRFSYLKQYLPDVYQEDAVSASFMERFLANPEGLLTALEEQIAQAQFLFDVRTVPEEYLPWLAGWFDLMLDESWPPWRKRLFLRHASELFAQRGTLQGMLRAVRLATDPSVDDTLFTADVTAEKPVRGLPPAVRVRESFRQKEGKAHRFVVQVPASGYGLSGGIDPEVVRRIVQQEKPAHTSFDVQSYWAMFRVGEARLGIDSVLGRAPRLAPLVLGQGYTAQTYLGYPPPWNLADRLLAGRDRLGSTPSL